MENFLYLSNFITDRKEYLTGQCPDYTIEGETFSIVQDFFWIKVNYRNLNTHASCLTQLGFEPSKLLIPRGFIDTKYMLLLGKKLLSQTIPKYSQDFFSLITKSVIA